MTNSSLWRSSICFFCSSILARALRNSSWSSKMCLALLLGCGSSSFVSVCRRNSKGSYPWTSTVISTWISILLTSSCTSMSSKVFFNHAHLITSFFSHPVWSSSLEVHDQFTYSLLTIAWSIILPNPPSKYFRTRGMSGTWR